MLTRTAGALAGAVVVLFGLIACESPRPTEVPTPEIVWETPEASGAPYDDPYVQAAYDASLGWVLAVNAADFTISQLTETTTAKRIDEVYAAHLGRYGLNNDDDPIAFVGPLPRTVVSVQENPEGDGAVVVVCDISAEWYVSEDHPVARVDGVPPLSLRLMIVDVGGTLKLDAVTNGDEAECDATDAAIGRFDPEPEPAEGPVRGPLD